MKGQRLACKSWLHACPFARYIDPEQFAIAPNSLPSTPRLVFRTGASYKRPTGLEAYHVPKQILPVFNDQVAEVWDEMGPQLHTYLDSIKIMWTSIDVVRFAEAKKLPGPIVLWIGVKPGTLSKEDAQTAAVGCEEILSKFAVADVEVAFRESLFIPSAGPKLFNYAYSSNTNASVRSPLTPSLSLPIAVLTKDGNTSGYFSEGSGGVYLSEGGDSKKIFILTARHVVLPSDGEVKLHNNESYCAKDGGHRIDVALLGEGSFTDFKNDISSEICGHTIGIDKYNKQLGVIQEMKANGDNDNVEIDRTMATANLQLSEASLITLNSLLSDVENHWSKGKQRIIGHIAYSPALSFNAGAQGYTEDWALIELEHSRIDWDKFKGNVIDLATKIPGANFTAMMSSDATAPNSFQHLSVHDLLPVQGILTEDELRLPQTKDSNDEPCTMVIKNGGTTGTTIGRASGIKSFVRNYFDDGTSMTSRQWVICGHNAYEAFSGSGDSGAIIVDGKGRVGGLIIGGAGQTDSIDITYATPFYWLLERIKTHFPNAHLY